MAKLERPALGRPVKLGMLYDCRSDTIIPDQQLWDPSVIETDRNIGPYNETHSNVLLSDNIDEKAAAFEMDSSVKLSLMCGLAQCAGSSEYIFHRKTGSQARVALHYKQMSRFEQLTFKHASEHNVQRHTAVDQGLATHVVTGILYGTQAVLVFDRAVSQTEKMKDIERKMQNLVEKMKSAGGEEEPAIVLSPEEEELAETIQCRYFGDTQDIQKPSNFKDAGNVYSILPSVLGDNGENAIPIKIWLYPLANLHVSDKPVESVSSKIITKTEKLLEGLAEFIIWCDDLKSQHTCADFPQFSEKFELFKGQVHNYRTDLQKTLRKVIPLVRGGASKEEEWAEILSANEKSPFRLDELKSWMKLKEKEINIIRSYMKMFPPCVIIRSRDQLEQMVLDPELTHLVCFSFPLLETDDEYLEALGDYLKGLQGNQAVKCTGWGNDLSLCRNMRVYAKQFSDFAQENIASKDTIFAVSGFDDGDEKANEAGCIFIYELGILVTKNFCPPGTPEKPEALDVSHDSVLLKWNPPKEGESEVRNYRVRYKTKISKKGGDSNKNWTEVEVKGKETRLNVTGLATFTEYEFDIASVCQAGTSNPTALTAFVTPPTGPPSKFKKGKVSQTSITVHWSRPSVENKRIEIEAYKVTYKAIADNIDEVVEIVTEDDFTKNLTIHDLQAGTLYRLWVTAVCTGIGEGLKSDPIDVQTCPTNRYTQSLAKKHLLLNAGDTAKGEPAIYKIPLKRGAFYSAGKYHTYQFGKGTRNGKKHTVIMVVGATGAGKSTLINGMINYITGVEWEDDFRFKIIDEEGEAKSKSQAHSQTQAITAYTIHENSELNLEYTLTIIDTPGFGDTRGIDRDRFIIDQIREFFDNSSKHHVDHIDAIGFVAQASQARLTHTQRYVFDSILSIFGKDVGQNIILLITFADGQKPPVVDAIKEGNIPCHRGIFKFNNSALFANKVGDPEERDNASDLQLDDNFDQMFWKMGKQSMRKFFADLNQLDPKSLSLTKEVLEERRRLEVSIEGLQPQIHAGCCKLEELRSEHQILEQHETDIEANQDFVYEVEVPKVKKVDISGDYITNCSKCHFTCHHPCGIPNDEDKSRCWAMSGGVCRICPGKCIWNVHFNMKYKFEYYSEKEKRTYSELEDRYKDATGKKLTVEQVIKKHEQEFLDVQKCVFVLITDSHQSLKRLEEIALKPNPLSTVEYVDLLIDAEKTEAKPNWRARVKALEDIRKQADIMSKIKRANFDPFENYKKEIAAKRQTERGRRWYQFWKF